MKKSEAVPDVLCLPTPLDLSTVTLMATGGQSREAAYSAKLRHDCTPQVAVLHLHHVCNTDTRYTATRS